MKPGTTVSNRGFNALGNGAKILLGMGQASSPRSTYPGSRKPIWGTERSEGCERATGSVIVTARPRRIRTPLRGERALAALAVM